MVVVLGLNQLVVVIEDIKVGGIVLEDYEVRSKVLIGDGEILILVLMLVWWTLLLELKTN